MNLIFTLFLSAINLQSLIICLAFAGINAGALKLAGKSGTAQVVDINSREEYDEVRKNINLRDHAIFIGYAPYDDPKFSIAVIIENGESGGRTAGPIAKEVLEDLLDVN